MMPTAMIHPWIIIFRRGSALSVSLPCSRLLGGSSAFIKLSLTYELPLKASASYAKLGPTACGSRLEGGVPSDYEKQETRGLLTLPKHLACVL